MIDCSPELRRKLNLTEFAVEANSFEMLCLWAKYSKESDQTDKYSAGLPDNGKVDWVEEGLGHGINIGSLDDRPVFLSLRWAMICNRRVMFYECTSVVADFDMAEKWVRDNCPNLERRTDAMNFPLGDIKERR